MRRPIRRKFSVKNLSLKILPITNPEINEVYIAKRISNKALTEKLDVLENKLIQEEKLKKKKNLFKKCYLKTKYYVNHIMESFIFHILILILSIFSLFNQDIMTLCFPISVDKAFHIINEIIFIFFFTELILFSIFKKNFFGCFYFYLDIVALISLLPEVGFIWTPLSYVLTGKEIDKNDPTMTNVVSNLHLVKASRTSQLGSKASKYIKLLRLLNFLKIARLSKVIEESQKIKREKINFLTNIFGKSEGKGKFKKMKGLQEKDVVNQSYNKGPKLIRFNSKFWNKKRTLNISTKKSFNPNNKGMRTADTLAINKIKENIFANRKASKDKNENDGLDNDYSSQGSYNYKKIFNPKLCQGESLRYDLISRKSTIKNINPEESIQGTLINGLRQKYSSRFKLSEEKINVEEEFKNKKKKNTSDNDIIKNSFIKRKTLNNEMENLIAVNTEEDSSKLNLIKVPNIIDSLNKANNINSKKISNNNHSMKRNVSDLSRKINSNSNFKKTSLNNIKNFNNFNKFYESTIKEKVSFSNFPKSPLSSKLNLYKRNNLSNLNMKFSKFSNSRLSEKSIKKKLFKFSSGKAVIRYLNNISYKNKSFKTYSELSSKKPSGISIQTSTACVKNQNEQLKDSLVNNILNNYINQFDESEIKGIIHKANSDDEKIINYDNPIKNEVNDFLIENDLNPDIIFKMKLEGLSDLERCYDEDNNLELFDNNKQNEIYNKLNIYEILNEKGESEENEEEIQQEEKEKLKKIHSDLSFSSVDSSRTEISFADENLRKNSPEKEKYFHHLTDVKKNIHNSNKSKNSNDLRFTKVSNEKNDKKVLYNVEKIPEIVHLDEKTNTVNDFYGDLKTKNEKNKNLQNNEFSNNLNKEEFESKNVKKKSKKAVEFEDEIEEEDLKSYSDKSDSQEIFKIYNEHSNKDEINLIKKQKNKIKKLNIEVEESNEIPDYFPSQGGKIKNSKTKKITKTEYITEEKIYKIENKMNNHNNKSAKEENRQEKFNVEKNNPNDDKIKNKPEEKTKIKQSSSQKSKSEKKNQNSLYKKEKSTKEKEKIKKKESEILLSPKSSCKKKDKFDQKLIQTSNDANRLILNTNIIESNKQQEQNTDNNQLNLIKPESETKIKENNKDKKPNFREHDDRRTLEETLMETLTQKVVILILLLLIMLPILGGEYVKTFLLNDDDTDIQHYCMHIFDIYINMSFLDSKILPNLKRHVESCERISVDASDHFDFNSTEPYFLYLNFSYYKPFSNLMSRYDNTSNFAYIPDVSYDKFTNRSDANFIREGFDYFTDYYVGLDTEIEDDDSKILFITNNKIFLIIDNATSIIKSIFVGVVLVWGAFLVSNDVNVMLIFPIERIRAKLKYLLNHSEEVYMKKEKLLDEDNDVTLLVKSKKHDKSLKESSLDKTEIQVIDSSIETLIDLVSLSLGQNVLKMLSRVKHNEKLKLDMKQEGIKFTGCFMFFKMTNLEKLFERYQENAMIIINKIQYVIHSIATIHLAEISNQRNLLIWKENLHEAYYNKIKYLFNLVDKPKNDVDDEMQKLKEDYNIPEFLRKGIIINIAILCANKIMASLMNNLYETFSIFLDCHAQLNFVIDYGEAINGLLGGKFKLDEVYISKRLTYFENIGNMVKYKLPSIIISNEVYESLSRRLKENFYISEIILKDKKANGTFIRDIIYRQYIDFSQKKYFEENIKEKKTKKDLDIFLKKSKINEETSSFLLLLKENEDSFEEFLIKDFEFMLNTNFINNNIISAINAIYIDILNKQYEKGQKKITHILKNIKTYNEIFEYNLSKNLENLQQKIKKFDPKSKNVFYTVDMTSSKRAYNC